MGRGLRAAVAMGELRTAVRTLALLDLEPAEVLSALDEVARGLGSPGGGERSEGLGGSGGAQWPSRAAQKSREADLSECISRPACTPSTTRSPAGVRSPTRGTCPRPSSSPAGPPGSSTYPRGCRWASAASPSRRSRSSSPRTPCSPSTPTAWSSPGTSRWTRPRGAAVRAHRSADGAGGRLRLRPLHPRHPARRGRHRPPDGPYPGTARGGGGDWTLPREPRSVGRARELARTQLLAWDLDDLVDTTELLVSELVTNALRYGEERSGSGAAARPHPGLRGLGRGPRPARAAVAPATPTRAAAVSSSSACSAQPGARAGPRAARPSGSNWPCRTGNRPPNSPWSSC